MKAIYIYVVQMERDIKVLHQLSLEVKYFKKKLPILVVALLKSIRGRGLRGLCLAMSNFRSRQNCYEILHVSSELQIHMVFKSTDDKT